MSSGVDRLVQTILQAIKQEKKTKAYFTQAEVKKVNGDTAWVHIPNGVEMTPVKKTINCKKGDIVQVRVGDGTATITGNGTAPPTDDTRAIKADVKAAGAVKKATKAQETADGADKKIKNLNQYFWAKEGSSSEAGAHVTEVPEDEFEANPTGGNVLIKSVGLLVRNGLIPLLKVLNTGITIGKEESSHIIISNDNFSFLQGTKTLAEIVQTARNTVMHYGLGTVGGLLELGNAGCRIAVTREKSGTLLSKRFEGNVYANADEESDANAGLLAEIYDTDNNTIAKAGVKVTAKANGDSAADISADAVKFNGNAPFTTYTASGTGTISANGDTSITFTGTLPTGYTPLALSRINVETHQSDVAMVEWYLNVPVGNGTVRLRNLTNSSISVDISVVVLCTSIK